VLFFKPAGVRLRDIDVVSLGLEELEALRLKDAKGFDQQTCAQHMRVSRPTFQRILHGARRKVAIALIHGKAIRVEGSVYDPHDDPGTDELEIHATENGYCPHCDITEHQDKDHDNE
jgi:predicted DNA-binding protein (UPF0251 family)